MTLHLYFDEDSINHPLTTALRARQIDVITALDAKTLGLEDNDQLDYATAQGRVLYSYNVKDYTRLHAAYLANNHPHAGIILAQQQRYGVGEEMRRLLAISLTLNPEAMHNRLEFLSNWG